MAVPSSAKVFMPAIHAIAAPVSRPIRFSTVGGTMSSPRSLSTS
jgi:hypothetical protein